MPLVSLSKRTQEKLSAVSIKGMRTVGDLRQAAARSTGLSVHRIELRKFTVNRATLSSADKEKFPSYNDDSKTLAEVGITEATEVEVKDLGPQFSYRGVFLVEYGGPILIALWFMTRPAIFFGNGNTTPVNLFSSMTAENMNAAVGTKEWNHFVQALAIVLWLVHFVKRELETVFVHKFSRATMPLSNLFKNSAYYWGFALAVGYPLVHPLYTAPGKTQVALALGLWIASQLTNLAVHVQLSGMRKEEGDKDRQPPKGFLFSLVSCPNYTAEVLGWVAWTLLSQIMMGGFFTVVGLLQMTQWALSKHRGYYRSAQTDEQKKSIKSRSAIIPFIL